MTNLVKIIECPRDAMQGIHQFVPTELKIRYIQQLINTGFYAIDFGSFVSSKAIPQMRDTHQIVQELDLSNSKTKLLAIVANKRGALEACTYSNIQFLGYPFSVSETFQIRNTNSNIPESMDTVKEIHDLCLKNGKDLVIYLSMAFGNPYGDEWNAEIVMSWVNKLHSLGIKIMALSDTIGVAVPESISYLFSNLIPNYPFIEFGAHFHTVPLAWQEKVEAAFNAGCLRFDGAINGYGGCPMAKDELTGNMPTENLILFFHERKQVESIKLDQFYLAINNSKLIFENYH
ncbi:MAG: hydroxymethylglutaryl-CoA lyase [Saprospiraceae bacterium]|nr:hydroxymethylglutaryl-CoA lyase [Saprospiraceae bacterium]MBK9728592.1 hydroxymethylglutaryl-CoA lyase [Saprospiraceae bacterium]